MKTLRIVLGLLTSLPIAIFIDSVFIHPDFYKAGSLGELLFLTLGIPILTLNYWVWVYPDLFAKNIKQATASAITVPTRRNAQS